VIICEHDTVFPTGWQYEVYSGCSYVQCFSGTYCLPVIVPWLRSDPQPVRTSAPANAAEAT
jgi:hypothetical protein